MGGPQDAGLKGAKRVAGRMERGCHPELSRNKSPCGSWEVDAASITLPRVSPQILLGLQSDLYGQ